MACTLLLCGVAWSSPARADANADEAAQLFRAASAAFQGGQYRAAAIGFEEANRRVPHGATMYNAATAWEAAGDAPRAADAYAEALRIPGLAGNDGDEARSRLQTLEKGLALVRVEGDEASTFRVAHVEGGHPPATVHVAPGEHRLTYQHPDGRRGDQRLRVAAGQVAQVVLAERKPAQPGPGPPVAPLRDGATQRTFGWVSLGAGALAFGVGAFLGVAALETRDEYDAGGNFDRELYDRADRQRIGANVAWAGAGALAITGVVLLLTAPSSHDPRATRRWQPSGRWTF